VTEREGNSAQEGKSHERDSKSPGQQEIACNREKVHKRERNPSHARKSVTEREKGHNRGGAQEGEKGKVHAREREMSKIKGKSTEGR